ncbi:MAG: DUF4296 domain-containing protein [Flavobacteriaceae bacterium]|jgi:hypothetical protein|nr:DUF4296 domain-containing protein [Flavobacteriaceae bacterium]
MKHTTVILLCFTLLLFSCQHALEKPKDLLSKEEMASILTEIYLYKQTPGNILLSKKDAFTIYVSLFKAHNTTKEIFQESYNYYYTDATALEEIYDNVINNLKDKLSEEQQKRLKKEGILISEEEEEKEEKEEK